MRVPRVPGRGSGHTTRQRGDVPTARRRHGREEAMGLAARALGLAPRRRPAPSGSVRRRRHARVPRALPPGVGGGRRLAWRRARSGAHSAARTPGGSAAHAAADGSWARGGGARGAGNAARHGASTPAVGRGATVAVAAACAAIKGARHTETRTSGAAAAAKAVLSIEKTGPAQSNSARGRRGRDPGKVKGGNWQKLGRRRTAGSGVQKDWSRKARGHQARDIRRRSTRSDRIGPARWASCRLLVCR